MACCVCVWDSPHRPELLACHGQDSCRMWVNPARLVAYMCTGVLSQGRS